MWELGLCLDPCLVTCKVGLRLNIKSNVATDLALLGTGLKHLFRMSDEGD